MTNDKQKPLEVLDLGEGLVCDAETGICEIPGASDKKPRVLPTATDKATTEEGGR